MSTTMPIEPDRAHADQQSVVAFHKELPRLRGWLRRHAAAWQGVDDLLQDLFLELVLVNRAARRVEDTGAWLFRVARNRITDALRQRQPLNRAVSIDASPESLSSGADRAIGAGDTDDPESSYQRARFVQDLTAALQELPVEQRSVFLAHEIDGLSIAQIASRDGIGVNTALARKRYAVLQLRERLAPFHHHYFTD